MDATEQQLKQEGKLGEKKKQNHDDVRAGMNGWWWWEKINGKTANVSLWKQNRFVDAATLG
jgi:hypothetical protein